MTSRHRAIYLLLFLLTICGLVIAQFDGAREWIAGVPAFTSGMRTPLLVKRDYSMADPTSPPLVAQSSTGGNCATTSRYRTAVAWVNEAGVTNLSPPSAFQQNTTIFRRIQLTLQQTPPSNALGWIGLWSGDGGQTWALCTGASSLSIALNSVGTSAIQCNCTGSTSPTTGTVSFKKMMTFGDYAHGAIGVASYDGTAANQITENSRILGLDSSTLPTWSTDGGVTSFRLGAQNAQSYTVCSTSPPCDYTTLNAFCAAKTSTSSTPLTVYIAAGNYTGLSTQSCTAQDSLSILGAGPGVSILDAGTNATIDLGASKNIVVAGLTLKGYRGIHWAGSGRGGISYIRNNEFISNNTGVGNEDCFLYGIIGGFAGAAGSELYMQNNRCAMTTDGFTTMDGNTSVFSENNVFTISSAPGGTSRFQAWALFGIPCIFHSVGDTFHLDTTPTSAHSAAGQGFSAYSFEGSESTSCSSVTTAHIRDASIYLNDKTANGTNADATGIRVGPNSTEAADIQVVGTTINVSMPNDSGNGNARGIYVENATSVVTVRGGTRIRTSGGLSATRLDLDGNVAGSLLVGPDVDFQTSDGNHGRLATVADQSGTDTFAAATTKAVTLPVAEPDANYLVTISCSANLTFWVSNKTTTGFTLNASASSSDSCDWRVRR